MTAAEAEKARAAARRHRQHLAEYKRQEYRLLQVVTEGESEREKAERARSFEAQEERHLRTVSDREGLRRRAEEHARELERLRQIDRDAAQMRLLSEQALAEEKRRDTAQLCRALAAAARGLRHARRAEAMRAAERAASVSRERAQMVHADGELAAAAERQARAEAARRRRRDHARLKRAERSALLAAQRLAEAENRRASELRFVDEEDWRADCARHLAAVSKARHCAVSRSRSASAEAADQAARDRESCSALYQQMGREAAQLQVLLIEEARADHGRRAADGGKLHDQQQAALERRVAAAEEQRSAARAERDRQSIAELVRRQLHEEGLREHRCRSRRALEGRLEAAALREHEGTKRVTAWAATREERLRRRLQKQTEQRRKLIAKAVEHRRSVFLERKSLRRGESPLSALGEQAAAAVDESIMRSIERSQRRQVSLAPDSAESPHRASDAARRRRSTRRSTIASRGGSAPCTPHDPALDPQGPSSLPPYAAMLRATAAREDAGLSSPKPFLQAIEEDLERLERTSP
eukprot:TRINITY_DN13729_c0_g1_i1.p1 TRINITY_DN13729_c0_g1~~TRINITY_DN13729_c0_g1_i1.p1  ORF type:complete len:553 (+),score=190.02 TRINITY_DN13729_c0_g1_i1:76-1659(+)